MYNIWKGVEREDWKTLEELLAIGVNNAPIHCDFMYGTADMEVDGVKEDGTVIPVIPVMRAGEFVENCSWFSTDKMILYFQSIEVSF